MKVWVTERGCYDERYVEGVFATAEAAMTASPSREGRKGGPGSAERPGGWQFDPERECWDNGLDWEHAVSVQAYEVK